MAFQRIPVIDVQNRIASVDQYEHRLFLGGEDGTIYRYNLRLDNLPNMISGKEMSNKIGKGKITALKYIEGLNMVLAQLEKSLHLIDADSLQRIQEIAKENSCEIFALDEEPKSSVQLAISRPDGKVVLYQFDGRNFIQKGDSLNCVLKADALAWYGRNIFISFEKKPYQVLDVVTKKARDIEKLKDLNLPRHILKILNEEEILILGPAECLIPFNTLTCEQLNKGVIEQPPRYVGISVLSPYVIILCEDKIQINNKYEVKGRRRLLQEILLDKDSIPSKGISTSDRLFFISNNKVFYLNQIPYEQQIEKSLTDGKVDDALLIFEQYVTDDDPEKNKKFEKVKLDAGWVHLRGGNLTGARDMLKDLNFDPREFLLWYPDFIPRGRELIQGEVVYKGYQYEKNKNEKGAQEFLLQILEPRRRYLFEAYTNSGEMNGPVKFATSQRYSYFQGEISRNRFKPVNMTELLELVDFALIKLYFALYPKFKEGFKQYLMNVNPLCKNMFNELENCIPSDIKNRSDPNSFLQALFYEQFGKVKEALDIWRSHGNSLDNKIQEAAAEETVRILKTVKDRNIIFEFLEWISKQYPAKIVKFFRGINDQLLNREKTLEWIKKVDPDNRNSIKEKYLETMVLENKVLDDTLHTMLALYYSQEVLFAIRPKSRSDPADDDTYRNNSKYNEYREKFMNFLKNPEARYSAESIIHDIKDSYLFDEEIYLCGKLKSHDKAIEKLLNSKKYLEAEKYCADRNENLLTTLFKRYIKRYEEALEKNQKDKEKELKLVISTFFKKYSSHPQLDPLEILDNIPGNFTLKDDTDENGIYTFLFTAFSSSLHQRRNLKMAKAVSEMDLFNSECNLFRAQGAHVKITKLRKCDKCGGLIGKKAFVVYPNGIVCDRNCTSDNFKICPVTKQDFEKSFTG